LSNVYGAGFKVFTLHVKFTIREIVQMSREWAFARTNSSGTHKDNATGVMTPEENQELFVLRKGADGVWKIARYSFSSTRSPPP
jgi:ketosteroid isomerase-like protein